MALADAEKVAGAVADLHETLVTQGTAELNLLVEAAAALRARGVNVATDGFRENGLVLRVVRAAMRSGALTQ